METNKHMWHTALLFIIHQLCMYVFQVLWAQKGTPKKTNGWQPEKWMTFQVQNRPVFFLAAKPKQHQAGLIRNLFGS